MIVVQPFAPTVRPTLEGCRGTKEIHCSTAQYNLGRLYETGRGGLPKDDQEALRLYKLAADQGNAVAVTQYNFTLHRLAVAADPLAAMAGVPACSAGPAGRRENIEEAARRCRGSLQPLGK